MLSLVRDMNPSLLGSSKLGLDDIYTSWQKFVSSRKAANDQRYLIVFSIEISKQFHIYNILRITNHEGTSIHCIVLSNLRQSKLKNREHLGVTANRMLGEPK